VFLHPKCTHVIAIYALDIYNNKHYSAAMYIDIIPNRKSPPAILLRESYREDGKIKKRTIANLSAVGREKALKFREILKGAELATGKLEDAFDIVKSIPHGHVCAILGMMNKLSFPALIGRGDTTERRNALAMIAGRILSPGSKLALNRHLSGEISTLAEELNLDKDQNQQELYRSMKWLLERQERIQKRLAEKHLHHGATVLYDLSSSYYEGSHCPLAQYGHCRDKKRGKAQINYGMLTNDQGCPVAVKVYPGNTGDPSTVKDQLNMLRNEFSLKRVVVVGDRGMLTSKQLENADDPDLKDFGWISALKNTQLKTLAEKGDIQMELFDRMGIAEIQSSAFPGERLVVCKNPFLEKERRDKRAELLEATEKKLSEITDATKRARNPYHGKDKIARRVQREAGRFKMLKHFKLDITEDSLIWQRDAASIEKESALDGFYVIRSINVSEEQMTARAIVETYKSLSKVERVFRGMKTISLEVRPIFHRASDMVRSHIFICMLAYYIRWQMEDSLKEMLFADTELEEMKTLRENPVERTQRSQRCQRKINRNKTDDGLDVHSFSSLMESLGTICRITCRPKDKLNVEFTKLSKPNTLQRKAFKLLGLSIPKECTQ